MLQQCMIEPTLAEQRTGYQQPLLLASHTQNQNALWLWLATW
jgi:hypothetical protein